MPGGAGELEFEGVTGAGWGDGSRGADRDQDEERMRGQVWGWVQGYSSKPGSKDSRLRYGRLGRQSHSPHEAPGVSHQKADSVLVAQGTHLQLFL